MTKGKFITFEGGEGSGKSTQSERLAERLRRAGQEVVVTREPGGSPFAEKLRQLLLAPDRDSHSALSEVLAFFAARADHLDRVIRPALAAGQWVLCDRFTDSTRVYQGHAGHVPLSAIDTLEALVVHPTVPDLTVLIDLDPALGLERAARRREQSSSPSVTAQTDPYEARDLAFHRQLREGFLAIAHSEPKRCVVVDGSHAMEKVADDVWNATASRLLKGNA